MSRRLIAGLLTALVACAGKDSGAIALALYGMVGSFVSRAAGACYAVCAGVNQVCNPETGFCEHNPCGPGCGSSRHCDIRGPLPRCVEDSEPADLVQSPPPPAPLPVATPPP
jgi:hypothetical protein